MGGGGPGGGGPGAGQNRGQVNPMHAATMKFARLQLREAMNLHGPILQEFMMTFETPDPQWFDNKHGHKKYLIQCQRIINGHQDSLVLDIDDLHAWFDKKEHAQVRGHCILPWSSTSAPRNDVVGTCVVECGS